MRDRFTLCGTSVLVLAVVGCPVPSVPAVVAPPAAPTAQAVPEPSPRPAEPEPEPEPEPDSYVPDEAVPLSDEVIGHVGLPCGTSTECALRARFAEKVSLYSTARGREALAKKVPTHDEVVAEIADVGDDGGRVQIICKAADYSARVFVNRSELLSVATNFVVATPTRTPSAPTDHPPVGISLVPGARVQIRRTKGDAAQIEFEQWGLRGTGWLPKSAIGRFYQPAVTDPRAPEFGHRHSVVWRDERRLRATPGGTAFATMRGIAGVAELGETRDEHVLVAVGFNLEDEIYAVGWLAEEQMNGGGVLGGTLGGSGSGATPPRRVRVPAEATLRSRAGEKVGVVRQDTDIECLADCETDTPMVRLQCVADFPARVDPRPDAGAD